MRSSIKVLLIVSLLVLFLGIIVAKADVPRDISFRVQGDNETNHENETEDDFDINEAEENETEHDDWANKTDGERNHTSRVTKEEQVYTFLDNNGEETQVRVRVETKEKNGMVYQKIKFRNFEADSEVELEEDGNGTHVRAILSNGSKKEIKIMPDRASERAIEVLQSKNITVVLKEVGEGNNSSVVYEVDGNKTVKFIGLFKVKAQLTAVVDAESGEVLKLEKPWWYFLAFGKGMADCDINNLDLCNESECTEIDAYWYNETCNNEAYVEPVNSTEEEGNSTEIIENSTEIENGTETNFSL